MDTLRAFDLFPMTHHVECVAGSSGKTGLDSSLDIMYLDIKR